MLLYRKLMLFCPIQILIGDTDISLEALKVILNAVNFKA
jgi:hypothetical protein